MSARTFPLVLNTALAACVGALGVLALGPNTADGYPGGAVVGYGQNPVIARGGQISGSTDLVFTAPSDQAIVISDLMLSTSGSDGYAACTPTVELTTGSGDVLGRFRIASYTSYVSAVNFTPANVSHAFASGLPVPAGETLHITGASGTCTVDYAIAGYYAQP